jgi:hypothetical protein
MVRILKTAFNLMEQELDTVIKVRKLRKYPPKPPSSVIKAKKSSA